MLIREATGANHPSLKAVSFWCPSRTYSYELNLCFAFAKFHSDTKYSSTDIAVITSFEQCEFVWKLFCSLLLKTSFLLLAASLRLSMEYQTVIPLKSRAMLVPIPTPQTSHEPLDLQALLTRKWRRTYYLSHLYPKEALMRVAAMSYSQGSCIGPVLM